MKKLFRIILLPFGLVKKCFACAIDGARDLENIIRFKNVIIDRNCIINRNTNIHPHVHILENCLLNNVEVGSFTYLGKNCQVQNASIGKFCSIANEVMIGLGNHPLNNFSTSPLFYRKNNPFNIELVRKDLDFEEYNQISVGHDVWIGARAIILDGITIGTGAVIAANSVVTKNVAPYAIVAGGPAKIIRFRFNDTEIQRLLNLKWWELDLNAIKHLFKD